MPRGVIRLAVLFGCGMWLEGQDRFSLSLPDHYPSAQFELGGALRITRLPVKRLVIATRANIDLHDVEIQINGQTMDTVDSTTDQLKFFEVASKSDLLEQSKPTIITAKARDAERFNNQWAISRHDHPWAVEAFTAPGGGTIRIELERPTRTLLAGVDLGDRFSGLVTAPLERLRNLVVGTEPALIAGKSGPLRFDAKVQFSPGQQVLVIAADGEKGSRTRLHYPILAAK